MKHKKTNSHESEFSSKVKSKPSDAYEAIKELLLQRVLNPGQKLLYGDLSKMIGMSKTPITSALNRLENEGFVVYEVNKGYRIKPIDKSEISELFEIRMDLECFNVRNAIRNLNDRNLEGLRKKFTTYSGYKPSFTDRRKLALDLDFHLEIARIGGNSYSVMFSKNIMEHIFYRYRLERGVEERKELVELEHQRVLEYIAEKDTSNAVKYMRQHVKALHKLMVQYSKDLSRPLGIGWL